MNPNALFSDYATSSKSEKLVVKGNPVSHGFQNTVIFFLTMWLPVILWYMPPTNNAPFWVYVFKAITIPMAFYLSWIFSRRFVKALFTTYPILEIHNKTLLSNLDKFHTGLEDIQKFMIIEETVSEKEVRYRLKLEMKEGEKTLPFAFTSYNKLDEILNLIKKAS